MLSFRTPITLLLLVFTLLAQAQAPITCSIHFESASAELHPENIAALGSLCGRLGDRLPTAITITGHTDDRGSDRYNNALSQRRADAVRAALRAACPDLLDVDIAWKGEQLPLADNGSADGRAQNRRVDVLLGFDEEASPEADQAHAGAFPTIRPLLPMADKQREHFTVDASKAIDIRTSEGWTVHIDGGAMVDAAGRSVIGPVDVTCRAFFTPAEAIASGIPMFVGHGDDAGHMESAGMYEVLATQGGQPLKLAQGNRISIQRPMEVAPGPDYNDYMLDPLTGQWQEAGPYRDATTVGKQGSMLSVTTVAPIRVVDGDFVDSLAAWWTYQQEMRNVPRMPDTLDFQGRQMSANYCLTTPCIARPDEAGMWKGRIFDLDRTNAVPSITLRTGRRHLAAPGRIYFQVKLGKSWLHPEWNVFGDDRYWVYAGPMQREQWLDSVARKHYYQDMELVASPGSDEGMLRLKSQGEWIELPLDLSTYRHTRTDEIAWDRQLATYQKRYANKARQFNDHLRAKTEAVKRRIQREEDAAYMMARRKMRPEEKALGKAEWIRTSQEQSAAYQARTAARILAVQKAGDPMWEERQKGAAILSTFTMSGFGIYNCDRILERRAIEPMVVAVVDENAEPFKWHTAYGVLNGRSAVITYWGNGTGKDDRLRLSEDMSTLLLVGKDNELLVVKDPGKQCAGRASARMQGGRVSQPASGKELEALVVR